MTSDRRRLATSPISRCAAGGLDRRAFLVSWGTNLGFLPVMGQPMSLLSAAGSHLVLFVLPIVALAVAVEEGDYDHPPNALIASDYVICVTLRAVPDIFNAEWLWDRVRSGQEGVLLLEALKRHPRRIARSSGQRQETYYSHVVIRISERDSIRDERLEDGFGHRLLLRELRRLHERDLGEHLAENATVRYRLEPDPVLRPGEVQALFGRAIYLPADDEAPAFRIEVTADGQSDWRDVGSIYPGQRLTLLNGDRRASSFAVVAWPFPGNESILLLRRSGRRPRWMWWRSHRPV